MKGRVLSIAGNMVTLEPEGPAACFGCMQECARNRAPVLAKTTQPQDLRPGQQVEAAFSRASFVSQGVTALLPPAAGFIAGFAGIGWIFPHGGEGMQACGGLILMFLASLGIYCFRRRFPINTTLHIKGEV
jgi:positive regulator of sigma E activity